MDVSPADIQSKYHKLASEYSKLRAQAAVLRRAVLEEQSRSGGLRENLKTRESALRRSEQEVDSLTFRNEQLLRRVGTLQDDLERITKTKKGKHSNIEYTAVTGTVFNEELQKKINEISQLSSQLADKDSELRVLTDRVVSLEARLSRQLVHSAEVEARLRKEVGELRSRNTELEGTFAGSEVGSLIGSEDALSASGSDEHPSKTPPVHKEEPLSPPSTRLAANSTKEAPNRIIELEKQVEHWKTECELLKVLGSRPNLNGHPEELKTSYELNARTTVQTNILGSLTLPFDINKENLVREENVKKYFTERLDALANIKVLALSKANSLMEEVSTLEQRLQYSEDEAKTNIEQIKKSQIRCSHLEEELATTRLNYEQQLRVMTEHVADLYDQLTGQK